MFLIRSRNCIFMTVRNAHTWPTLPCQRLSDRHFRKLLTMIAHFQETSHTNLDIPKSSQFFLFRQSDLWRRPSLGVLSMQTAALWHRYVVSYQLFLSYFTRRNMVNLHFALPQPKKCPTQWKCHNFIFSKSCFKVLKPGTLVWSLTFFVSPHKRELRFRLIWSMIYLRFVGANSSVSVKTIALNSLIASKYLSSTYRRVLSVFSYTNRLHNIMITRFQSKEGHPIRNDIEPWNICQRLQPTRHGALAGHREKSSLWPTVTNGSFCELMIFPPFSGT